MLSFLHQPGVIVPWCLVEAQLDASGLLNLLVLPNATSETTPLPPYPSPHTPPTLLPSSSAHHSLALSSGGLHTGENATLYKHWERLSSSKKRFYLCPPDVFFFIINNSVIIAYNKASCREMSCISLEREKIQRYYSHNAARGIYSFSLL